MATQLGEDRRDALCYQLQGAHLYLQLCSFPEDHLLVVQTLIRAHHHIRPLLPSAEHASLDAGSWSPVRPEAVHHEAALECVEGALWLMEHHVQPGVPPRAVQLGIQGVARLILDALQVLVEPAR